MCTDTDVLEPEECSVTFHPPLHLQRQGWVLDIMRREGIREASLSMRAQGTTAAVIDVGCGEGELLSCLRNPAPWLAPADARADPGERAVGEAGALAAAALADVHRDILHPVRIAGLDVGRAEVESVAEIAAPPPPEDEGASLRAYGAPVRWEPLSFEVWQGSLADVNPAFVGVECIVATEVIEHLPDPILARFAPVLFGAYHPRLVLLTTPSYTFNARFLPPDAPISARRGWPDPTGRTARVFRHPDHKFEWTREEWAAWCAAAAEEWGYTLEPGGVGRAHEKDEWGRDDILGWASQTAAFVRREGARWAQLRAERWRAVAGEGELGPTEVTTAHRLVASHEHPAHPAAGAPLVVDAIGELVVARMADLRETETPLLSMWFVREVELACGGRFERLLGAVRAQGGLALAKLEKDRATMGTNDEWVVRLDPALHHLLRPREEPDRDPWASPTDLDCVTDSWEPSDPSDEEDGGWDEQAEDVVVRETGDVEEPSWGDSADTWGSSTSGWSDSVCWGGPAGDAWGRPDIEDESTLDFPAAVVA
ncbi:uncharacterized protein BXZ73DRAFT_96350 [Epithele typhae]|uniref:uncharacterized protein n=1 Tax=Epithele typhae TaxID=378194 RepID=UPI002008D578|nr:uncharacterized protein BXZ73DRAFT_96350 [Epithele typhae]KAH9945360.1 hypothetical protein BXZ73DRAFT_96350 [Epithele typhae]